MNGWEDQSRWTEKRMQKSLGGGAPRFGKAKRSMCIKPSGREGWVRVASEEAERAAEKIIVCR